MSKAQRHERIPEAELAKIERQLCELWGQPTDEAIELALRNMGRLVAAYRHATKVAGTAQS